MKKKILIGLAILFVVIQFVNRTDKSVPEVDASKDFLRATNAPENVIAVFKTACYDCHSYHTRYPWYSNVAPVSWWISGHIEQGREEMNLSTWTDYSQKKKDHKLEKMVDAFENGWMPLGSYTIIHRDALVPFRIRYEVADWLKTLN